MSSSETFDDAVLCNVPKCKNWAKSGGRCKTHNLEEKKFEKGSDDDGKTVMKPKVVIKSDKDQYYGGHASCRIASNHD